MHKRLPGALFEITEDRETTNYPAPGHHSEKLWHRFVMEYYAAPEKNGDFSLDFGREKSPGMLSEKNKAKQNPTIQKNVIACNLLGKKKGRNKIMYLYLLVLALTYTGKINAN